MTVELPDGGATRALAVACGGVGERTRLSLRPERVEIGGAGNDAVAGKVLELIYLGDHIRVRMAVHGNDDFVVKVPNASEHAALRVGETAPLTWRAEDCRALDAA